MTNLGIALFEARQIKEAMEQSLYPGSQTFEQSLCKLYLDERISYDEAMIASDSATNLAWLINQNSPAAARASSHTDTIHDCRSRCRYATASLPTRTTASGATVTSRRSPSR